MLWLYLLVDLLLIFIVFGVCVEGSVMFWNKVYDGVFGWFGELLKFGVYVLLFDLYWLIMFGGL